MKPRYLFRIIFVVMTVTMFIFVASWKEIVSCAENIEYMGFFYSTPDYSNLGWRRVEVPTNTGVRATIQMPQEWDFRVEKGWVKIIDTTTDQLIAEQMYECRQPSGMNPVSTFIYNEAILYDVRIYQDGNWNKSHVYVADNGGFNYVTQYTDGQEVLYGVQICIGCYDYPGDNKHYSILGGFLFYYQDLPTIKKVMRASVGNQTIDDYFPDDSTYN